ncbi:MAG TPA: IPT/TIG domain-containing protein [Candidatus Sumerlaeota bacterium]|nr:IPT/TIG domain-containing protein [Candidatus Sumerlaeota bacterium]
MNGIFNKYRHIVMIMACVVMCVIPRADADAGDAPGKFGKVTLTLDEMRTMAEAMDIAFIDISCYVALENLNDLLSPYTVHDFDNIDQHEGTWVLDLATAFFRADKVSLAVPGRLWQGPYVTWQDSRISIDGAGYDRGSPLDLWGTPYYLFSPAGLVRGDSHTITLELYGDHFDSWAIVSLGPDCVKSGDDICWTFGLPPTRLILTSLSRSSAFPGEQVSLRGYNFGAGSRSTPAVYLNDRPVNTLVSWTDRQIVFTLPENAESGDLKVTSGSETSNAMPFTVQEHPTGAGRAWTLYE